MNCHNSKIYKHKTMKKITILLISILMTGFVFSQENSVNKANDILKNRGEVYFSFSLSENNISKQELNSLARLIYIDKITDNKVIAYANDKGFNEIVKNKIKFELLTPPSMLHESILNNSTKPRSVVSFDYYPSWSEYNDMMNQFVVDFPNLCELVVLGTSMNGKEILAIHINNNLGVDQNEPEFLYTSTMHGDEVVGYVLMLRYIDYLLNNYGIDPEITNMVDNIDIWINPLANPDGTYAGGDNSVWGATRSNANNVDLNRNFPDPEDGPHPDGNPWQTETVVFMDFAEDRDFTMSSNMHGGAEVLNYPWDTWQHLTADDDWWVYVCREYADIAQANSPSGYMTDLNNGITNGYAWYTTSGCRQDYMNYFHNCREMTLELSELKMPPESQLDNFWNYNYKAFNAYMKQSMHGFSGIVTNAYNGNPLQAEVVIENHDADNSWVYSHAPVGDYHRPIKAGTYDVTFSAFGCYDQTISVNIVDDEKLVLDVQLIPIMPLTSEFSSSTTITSTETSVDFFDTSWGMDIISWNWTFEGGTPSSSTDENPTGIIYETTGEFDVTLVVSDLNGDSDTEYIEDYMIIKDAVLMKNEVVTICDALYYDSGSEVNDYSNDEDYTMTFYPEYANYSVVLDFIEFDIQNHLYCDYDYLEIFDGIDINAPSLGKWCSTNGPNKVIASNDDGALTVFFHSNSSITAPGWKALVSCDSNVGVVSHDKEVVFTYPNPVGSKLYIEIDGDISEVFLFDNVGRRVFYSDNFVSGQYIDLIDFNPGIYIVSCISDGVNFTNKVVVVH